MPRMMDMIITQNSESQRLTLKIKSMILSNYIFSHGVASLPFFFSKNLLIINFCISVVPS